MTVFLTLVGTATGFLLGAWYASRRARPVDEMASSAVAGTAEVNGYELVEDHRDGVVVADARGRVMYRNLAARRLHGTHTGLLVDEAVDRHIATAVDEGHSHDVLELFGPPKVVLVIEARRLDDQRIVVTIENISERRRVEQVRTDFVANVSHELKTPIGGLSVLAETLEEESDLTTIRRVVRRMMSEAERATRTIDDLIELARLEAGNEASFESVELGSVISGAIDRVMELASQRDIDVDSGPSGELDAVAIFGDRTQLVSALGNLVENAVKYSERGGQVQIRTRLTDGQVEFAVVDQGVGIPQRDLDRIFERFHRVDRARSRETGGTGLGLSIVRHVAHNHGGDVSVVSTEGEGSTFTLRLPARADGLRGPLGSDPADPSRRADGGGA